MLCVLVSLYFHQLIISVSAIVGFAYVYKIRNDKIG